MGLIVVMALVALPLAADDTGESSPVSRVSANVEVRPIADGVWVHTTRRTLSDGREYPGNGLIVRNGGEAILVDTAWGVEETAALVDWVEGELGLPVSLVIVTHFHDDSMGGMPVLASRDIRAVAHPLALELGGDTGMPLPEALDALRTGTRVTLGNVEVFYPGPAHSRDNLVAWVPHARVVFGSCAVRSPVFPGKGNTADADVEQWPRAMERVRQAYPEAAIVVPGHGPPGGPELLTHTISLFGE